MTVTDDTRDRLIQLETDFKHMAKAFEGMASKVDEMHELLLKAKGAKWMLGGIALVAGWLGGKAGALLPWIASLPKL